jgi:acetylornithine deacetylase/succinyl-diaminopimelate desuccinylase-like protein
VAWQAPLGRVLCSVACRAVGFPQWHSQYHSSKHTHTHTHTQRPAPGPPVQPVEGKNPVVLGRLGSDPAKPTVCFYGHYDVQPAMEEGWATDPFTLHSQDGWLCGRGTTDNKGEGLGGSQG